MKLELAQQFVDWRCVGEGDDRPIPRWRMGLAGSAILAVRCGFATARAGLVEVDLWPLWCAVRADQLIVGSGAAAEHAGRREERTPQRDERAPKSGHQSS